MMSIKKADKSDILIQSAMQLFAEKGYHQTKIKDITDNADLGAGTFYLYFKSKDELLEELMKKYLDQLMDNVNEIYEKDIIVYEKLRQIINTQIAFLNQNKTFFQVYLEHIHTSEHSCNHINKHRHYRNKILNLIEKLIIEGQRDGYFLQNINPFVVARSLHGMVVFTVMGVLIIDLNEDIEIQELTDNICQIFFKGIENYDNAE